MKVLEFLRREDEDEDEEYQVLVEQEDDGSFVATSPALPGYVAYGPSQSAAVRKLRKAIRRSMEGFAEDWVTVSRGAGRATSRHKSHLHFRLPLTMTAKLVLGGLAMGTAVALLSLELRRRE